MISQRTRGLQNTLLACQALIVMVLMAVCTQVTFTLVTSATRLQLERYPVYALVVALGLAFESLHRDRSISQLDLVKRRFLDQHRITLRQMVYAIGALLVYLALMKDQFISRSFVLLYVPVVYVALLLSNYHLPRILARRIFRGCRGERTLFVGPTARVAEIRHWVEDKEVFGLHSVGLLTNDVPVGSVVHGFTVLGDLESADVIIPKEGVTQVIALELPEELPPHKRLIQAVEKFGIRFAILSNLEEKLDHPVVHIEDDGYHFITLREEPLENPLNRILKRLLDLAVALPVVCILLPLAALLVWIVQRFQSPGPLLYRQVRAGIQNRTFDIIKFRTMHVSDSDAVQQAVRSDERVYSFGRWMRRFSVDELPQFINVLKGEMSVTGPRPHMLEHNAQFAKYLANYHIRASVKPGITGLAQIRGFRGEARNSADIAQRVASDLSYLENWRLALDIAIIARTAWHVIAPPKTAY